MNKNVNHCDLKTMTKQKRENDMKTRKIKRYKNTKHTHTHMCLYGNGHFDGTDKRVVSLVGCSF